MVKKIKAFCTLVRWPNLLMIALMPLLIRYGMLKSSLTYLILNNPLSLVMSSAHFLMLVMGIVALAAAGYVMNDYVDVKIDAINKPDKRVVGVYFNENQTIKMYWILNVLSLVLIFLVCYRYALTGLFFLFLLASGLLWFYSTTYKHIWLLGNLLVALVVAVLPLLPCVMDIILLNRTYGELFVNTGTSVNYLAYWILAFSGFAFLYTLIREVIKDMEDVEGDRTYGSKTIPIVFGLKTAKILVVLLYVLAITTLYILHNRFLGDRITFWYLSLSLVPCSFLSLVITIRATNANQFHLASSFNKLATVFGILFAGVFYYIIEYILV